MSSEIRLGIIGCGRILNAHLRGFKILQEKGLVDFRIAALCARKEEDLHRFRKRGEGPGPRPAPVPNPNDPLNAPHSYISDLHPDQDPELFTDYRDLLANGSVDAVCIYTGHSNHHGIAIDALNAGKHVAIEKPMAISVKAAQRMCEAAEKNDRVLGIDENAHYSPGTLASSWAVRQGVIGNVVMVFQSSVGGRNFRPDLVAARTPWRQSRIEAGGGASIDLGVHLFNRIRTVAGPIKSVYGLWKTLIPERVLMDAENKEVVETVKNDVDDGFFANFELEAGGIGHLTMSKTAFGISLAFPGGMNVWGDQGALSSGKICIEGEKEKDALDYFSKHADPATVESVMPSGITDAFALEQLDFLTGIRDGRPMRMLGEEGLIDLALSYAILESHLAGRPLTVKEMLAGDAEAYQKPINDHYGL